MLAVIPLTNQSDYTELKFSLRSIEKFLNPDEVVIIGDVMPEWINNVTQISLPNIAGQPNYSVRRKVIAALHYVNEFLYMNDDIYLLEKAGKDFPYYSSGLLDNKPESGAKPLFTQLRTFNKPTKYFGHYPCVYKKDFIDIIDKFSNECITKSAYCNFIEVETIEIPDCKLLTSKKPDYIREFIKDKPCFSTGIYSIKEALPVLQELFPKPSIFELT